MPQVDFELTSPKGAYAFCYDTTTRGVCLTKWPNGQKAMRIIAARQPATLELAKVAGENYIRYVECDYQSC
jgi:hypothetical protein